MNQRASLLSSIASPMRLSILLPAAAGALFLTSAFAAERVQFNRDIRPIFSDTCYACHGPDENKVKGKLRLRAEVRQGTGGHDGLIADTIIGWSDRKRDASLLSGVRHDFVPSPASIAATYVGISNFKLDSNFVRALIYTDKSLLCIGSEGDEGSAGQGLPVRSSICVVRGYPWA